MLFRSYSRLVGSRKKSISELQTKLNDLSELVSYNIMNDKPIHDELRAIADTISLMNPGKNESGTDLTNLFKQYLTENTVVKEWGSKTLDEVFRNDPVIKYMTENAATDLSYFGRGIA